MPPAANPRIASAALAFTVVPGSLGGHLFWSESDPERKAQKRRDLLTDLSLLGGLTYGAMFVLAHWFDPKPREITVSIPPDKFSKQR